MTRAERAYYAGFLDGEGCITLYRTDYSKGKGYMAVRVIIGQNTREVLDIGCSIWGGSVTQRKDGHFVWSLSGRRATRFVEDLYPFIVVKKEQAILVSEYQKLLDRSLDTEEKTLKKMAIVEAFKGLNSKMGFAIKKERIVI